MAMEDKTSYKNRQWIVLMLFGAVALVYLVRLFCLQILEEKWKSDADINALRRVVTAAPRGIIYDRNGEKLVDNEISYDLMVVPRNVANFDTAAFCRILKITQEDMQERFQKAKAYSTYVPSVFYKQMPPDVYAHLMERSYRFSGFYVFPRTIRKYYTTGAAHTLGYIAEVNYNDMEKDNYYAIGDYIGKSGVERSYEKELRGQKGIHITLVDNFGREKGPYMNGTHDTNAVPGTTLWASIDKNLQEYGELLMSGKRGSIVAIEPCSGEILALVTSPTYDPSLLVGSDRGSNYLALHRDSLNKPLFNRALMAQYPPGSTFKVANALVFQQTGAVDENTRYGCSRGFHYGNRKLGCHAHASPLGIAASIQNSCNAWYCRGLIAMLDDRKKYKSSGEGYKVWREFMLKLGFGKAFESDLPYELKGFIPEVGFYDKYYGKDRWRATNIISISIGQGEILATPVQLANLAAIVANRGYYYKPHLIKALSNKDSLNPRFVEKIDVGIEGKYFDPVLIGMENAVLAGTARRSSVPGIRVAAKTGTAENPHGNDHSLLICFAPVENPKIALCVIVENGGFGATWAAPIASLMLEKYLKDSVERLDLEASIAGKEIYYTK